MVPVTKWKYSINFLAKNVLLTFQMEQNGTFLGISKYDNQILHKKLDLLFVLNY